jgi:Dihaem cytochrome c
MIAKNRYRLREYQICEYEDGSLWWNAHHGFAERQSGKCFIYEDILMFGEFIDKEDGFLKKEFLQGLKKLPVWNKTKFYCFLSDLLDVSSGRNAGEAWGSQVPAILNEKQSRAQDIKDESPRRTFRLDKYRITVSGTNQISWQSLEGIDRVVGGQCIIQSDILFIGPKNHEAGTLTSHEFYNGLNELAPWKITKFWGSSLALRPCESPQTGRPYNIGEKARGQDTKYAGEKVFTTLWKECQEAFRSLWPSGSKLKGSWGRQPRLVSSFKFRGLSSHFHGLLGVRIFEILPLLMRRVIGPIRNLYLWSTDHIPHTSFKRIMANRVDVKKRYKRIVDLFISLKRYLLLVLILIMQAGGFFHVTFAYDDDLDRRHRNRYRERHRYDASGRCQLKAVSDPTYKEHCGACHFAFQPELLPSESWESILNQTDNHFGESFELDAGTRKAILGYLQTNAAEHSASRKSLKIMRSLEGQAPMRISEIPYIRGKHRQIPAATIKRQSIGSLSNCMACHTRAQEGIYDDDGVVIPK